MNFDLTKWLADIGLPEYAEAFLTERVDEQSLQEQSDTDLRELGVDKMGHSKTILREAAKLASGSSMDLGTKVCTCSDGALLDHLQRPRSSSARTSVGIRAAASSRPRFFHGERSARGTARY